MSTGHVLAEWVPLHGEHARRPVPTSWRARVGFGVFDLIVMSTAGIELIHTTNPFDSMQWLEADIYTHWLEGHPEQLKL